MQLDLYRFEIWKLDEVQKVKVSLCDEIGYNIYDAIYQFFRFQLGDKLIMGEYDSENGSADFSIIYEDGSREYFRCIETNEFVEKYDPQIHDWEEGIFDEGDESLHYSGSHEDPIGLWCKDV